jgi:hypothetical protein
MALYNMIEAAGKTARVSRRPQHRFYLETQPWQIQPFLIAPVLPMETMKNALIQSRVVTDPIRNKLIGWWQEYFIFYVKLRDLEDRDDFTQMMLEPAFDQSAAGHLQTSAADVPNYTPIGGMKWVQYCLDRVVTEFFRNELEAQSTFEINGVPSAAHSLPFFGESGQNAADYITAQDIDVDLDADSTITASEIERARRMFELQRLSGVTEMSFEDYLRSFGIRTPESEEPHRPELLRQIREWSYPTNTIADDGSASSAVSWSIADRLDKSRFFTEPGFVFGVTVTRPKIYFANQSGNAASLLSNAFTWLPAASGHDVAVSWREVANGEGPFDSLTDVDGYWIDVRDLFVHGDQFVNVDLSSANGLLTAALPTDAFEKFFPSATDAAALFVDDDPGTAILVRQDGVVSFNILGTQRDHTPQG